MSAYVLVLDDDEMLRELVEAVLSGEGYRVRCAASIADALEIATRQQPGLVLFDLTLGMQRGEEFVTAYRQIPHATARLIATSGAADLVQRATALNVDGHLRKPWELDDLLCIVQDSLMNQEA